MRALTAVVGQGGRVQRPAGQFHQRVGATLLGGAGVVGAGRRAQRLQRGQQGLAAELVQPPVELDAAVAAAPDG